MPGTYLAVGARKLSAAYARACSAHAAHTPSAQVTETSARGRNASLSSPNTRSCAKPTYISTRGRSTNRYAVCDAVRIREGREGLAPLGGAFFFKQKTAYEISLGLVGSEMCIRDRQKERAEAAVAREAGETK